MPHRPPFLQNAREVLRLHTSRVLCRPFWWVAYVGATAEAAGIRLLVWGERASRPSRARSS